MERDLSDAEREAAEQTAEAWGKARGLAELGLGRPVETNRALAECLLDLDRRLKVAEAVMHTH